MRDKFDAAELPPNTGAINNLQREEHSENEFPGRPRNENRTLPFKDLFIDLFNPLAENRKKPTGSSTISRRKTGPFPRHSPREAQRLLVERFITKWRTQVGPDIFPAFRLIVPDKDKDRMVYGLKERAIARLLINCLQISKSSADAEDLLNWKLPASGMGFGGSAAGDFAGRCFNAVHKRSVSKKPSDMTIAEVNELLDELSKKTKGSERDHIFKKFYQKMNAEEIMWLVRIILRQMRTGVSELTLFRIWHPDAEALFKVSSSLRKVCWDLYDPQCRLEGAEKAVRPMSCFQPQCCHFGLKDFSAMVRCMKPTEKDPKFWIEEKLDGERIQLHMKLDDKVPGGKEFKFWSRKAKEYTYLYGGGLYDQGFTMHLANVFHERVFNVVLDGEMVAWDPMLNGIAPFGTLKTAALAEQSNSQTTSGQRPCLLVFDILFLNDEDLTKYDLYSRRQALEACIVQHVKGRFEIHKKLDATTAEEIEDYLRTVIAQASEGLVIKNPRSAYSLNDRNDNWMKVKPEYMTEYGEQLDCVVIGGYYGTGYRGGELSSFLCGLKVDENQVQQGANPMKCLSFFKVGGGFLSSDYKKIRQMTEGKWRKWDSKRPPREFIELGGDYSRVQYERPDLWIKAEDSIILSVKAASVTATDKFACGFSLRFPRFQSIREDRDWTTALTVQEFLDLQREVDKKKQLKINEDRKKRRSKATKKRAVTVLGLGDDIKTPYAGPATDCFKGLDFYVMGGSQKPVKKSKPELEQLVKANGGIIHQTYDKKTQDGGKVAIICIADANLVQVNVLKKRETNNVIRPSWLFDCIKNAENARDRPQFVLPYEPKHVLFALEGFDEQLQENVDPNGDSYARDVGRDELRKLLDEMPTPKKGYSGSVVRKTLGFHSGELPFLVSWTLRDLDIAFVGTGEDLDVTNPISLRAYQARHNARFMGAITSSALEQGKTTHVVVCGQNETELKERAAEVRREISTWTRLPRLVGLEWVEICWQEKTRIDEERLAVT